MRERKVLVALCRRKQQKQIAEELGVSKHSVKNTIARMLKKFGLSDADDLKAWAMQHPRAVYTGDLTAEYRLHPDYCACDAPYCFGMREMDWSPDSVAAA